MDDTTHHLRLAEAYRRGAGLPPGQLRMHPFKRTGGLPRVRRVLGMLRALQPGDLLDLGPGRGAGLWPLLDALPAVPVTALDRSASSTARAAAVARGGVQQLTAARGDLGALPFADRSFDGVLALEVLEHQRDPAPAAAEAMRVARRFVIASVPSKPDDNPEHVSLLAGGALERLLLRAGAARVKMDAVLNHTIALAMVATP